MSQQKQKFKIKIKKEEKDKLDQAESDEYRRQMRKMP